MRYFEKLPGERLYLSPMNPEDAALYTKWLNDMEVTRWLGNARFMCTLAAEREYLESGTKDNQHYNFSIILRDGDRLLGSVGLKDVNPVYRTAALGIFIGEAEDRSKGYGAEAIRLLLGFGFRWLGLHNIDLQVNSGNARAIACYEKVGFREYGRRREAIFTDGGRQDCVMMEVLTEEYLAAQG